MKSASSRKLPLVALTAGCLLTLGTLAICRDYCMGGPAHGWPAAITRPSHGDSLAAIQLEPDAKAHGTEVSLGAIGLDLLLWSGICVLVQTGTRKIKSTRGL
jgi:hypothetical protein